MEERHFYHSFPRPRQNENQEYIIQKGLKILENVAESGLMFAPEILEWKQANRTIKIRQNRISFTELSRSEVVEHSKKFGPFSLRFNIDVLRRMGALPVIYIPQSLRDNSYLSVLGTMIVAQLNDAKYTLSMLHELLLATDHEHVLKQAGPSATHVSDEYRIELKNTEGNNVVVNKSVSAQSVRDILEFIGFKNAPFELMASILTLTQSLFYPTDDEIHDELLSYYRQREWRIAGGMVFNNVEHGRLLTEDEKGKLLAIDKQFWSNEISDDQNSFIRINEVRVLNTINGLALKDLIAEILVPKPALEKAREIFGEIVNPY